MTYKIPAGLVARAPVFHVEVGARILAGQTSAIGSTFMSLGQGSMLNRRPTEIFVSCLEL